MYLLLAFLGLLCISVCITALIFHNESPGDPFLMRGKLKYYVAAGAFIYTMVSVIIIGKKQFENEPKPAYEMIDQGHYYKMVPNN